jgi:hypothetical protein
MRTRSSCRQCLYGSGLRAQMQGSKEEQAPAHCCTRDAPRLFLGICPSWTDIAAPTHARTHYSLSETHLHSSRSLPLPLPLPLSLGALRARCGRLQPLKALPARKNAPAPAAPRPQISAPNGAREELPGVQVCV